jgi:hypothetical protein
MGHGGNTTTIQACQDRTGEIKRFGGFFSNYKTRTETKFETDSVRKFSSFL